MAMPETLVLVRHGLSEPNKIQRLEKHQEEGTLILGEQPGEYEIRGLDDNPNAVEFIERNIGILQFKDQIYDRPDNLQRLAAPEGVEQARIAGQWLTANFLPPSQFDERYTTTFNRGIDTGIEMSDEPCLWLADFRIVERDWGIYGATPREDRPNLFPHTEKLKEGASFYVRYDNGESIMDTAMRIRSWIDTLDRDNGDKKVLAVTHGETMWAARAVIERMMPQEYQDLDADKTLRIGNCCIMICTRTNPEDPDPELRAASLSSGWMRMIDPVEPEKSPYGGEWRKLPGKRRFSEDQLRAIVDRTPRILG